MIQSLDSNIKSKFNLSDDRPNKAIPQSQGTGALVPEDIANGFRPQGDIHQNQSTI